ncbi:hypothetical protein MYVALT_F_02830 [Candidatus Vallotia tarda]|uniref:Uncharacterized protein n=1 Tax=Candidatus Vallotiella hemipterorum TaxID=1177213 RepID=A0A916NG58_9BURK|nr:hypothetical protein MYVALT_F_02830 [Candidatus Vallotia tarda]
MWRLIFQKIHGAFLALFLGLIGNHTKVASRAENTQHTFKKVQYPAKYTFDIKYKCRLVFSTYLFFVRSLVVSMLLTPARFMDNIIPNLKDRYFSSARLEVLKYSEHLSIKAL